jgi:hypothetical protein
MKLIQEFGIKMVFSILILIPFFHCERKPYVLKYPIEVNLFIDSTKIFETYSPEFEFGPTLILNVKNTGLDNIFVINIQNKISKVPFVPTYNRIMYFKGPIDNPVNCSDCSGVREYWSLDPKTDTLRSNKEKKYRFDPTHSDIFQDSISFVFVELPIKSPYFDSLNIKSPFVYDRFYFKGKTDGSSDMFAYIAIKHPFFVFSTHDSLNLVNFTDAFIEKGVLKLKK